MLKEKYWEVGNLVRLTYYGRNMKSNPPWMTGTKGNLLLGVITDITPNARYPIHVQWFHEQAPEHNVHSFRELKITRS